MADDRKPEFWPDWLPIMAETLRAVIETHCHPQSLEDAKRNLAIYDEQKSAVAKYQESRIA